MGPVGIWIVSVVVTVVGVAAWRGAIRIRSGPAIGAPWTKPEKHKERRQTRNAVVDEPSILKQGSSTDNGLSRCK